MIEDTKLLPREGGCPIYTETQHAHEAELTLENLPLKNLPLENLTLENLPLENLALENLTLENLSRQRSQGDEWRRNNYQTRSFSPGTTLEAVSPSKSTK